MKKAILFTVLALAAALTMIYTADIKVALYFNEHTQLRPFFEIVTFFGRADIFLIFSVIVYLVFRKKDPKKAKTAKGLFLSIALSGIAVLTLKSIFARYRPKMLIEENLYGFNWFDIGYSVASFPSGHTTTAFAVFVYLALVYRKYALLLWSIALLIGFSRVVLGAHYPSDVIAGAVLGSWCAYISHRAVWRG